MSTRRGSISTLQSPIDRPAGTTSSSGGGRASVASEEYSPGPPSAGSINEAPVRSLDCQRLRQPGQPAGRSTPLPRKDATAAYRYRIRRCLCQQMSELANAGWRGGLFGAICNQNCGNRHRDVARPTARVLALDPLRTLAIHFALLLHCCYAAPEMSIEIKHAGATYLAPRTVAPLFAGGLASRRSCELLVAITACTRSDACMRSLSSRSGPLRTLSDTPFVPQTAMVIFDWLMRLCEI